VRKSPIKKAGGKIMMLCTYRLGEKMCMDCAKSVFYAQLENGNHVLTVTKREAK
jgi:hypothetical protein